LVIRLGGSGIRLLALANLPAHDMARQLLAITVFQTHKAGVNPCAAAVFGVNADYFANGPGLKQFRRQSKAYGNMVTQLQAVIVANKGNATLAERGLVPMLRLQRILLKGHNARQNIQLGVENFLQALQRPIALA
jgi:hypothetical protein